MGKKRKGEPLEFDREKKILRVFDTGIFPLQVDVVDKVKRRLIYKEEGKKGPSLFVNRQQ